MALALTVTKRRPDRVIDVPAQTVLGEPRNPKILTLEDVIVEPLSNCTMLEPIYAPENYMWGADAYQYSGVSEDEFLTLESVFGREGRHVMRTHVNDTTPWTVGLKDGATKIATNRGTYVSFFWWRPPDSVTAPDLDIFPRIELNVTHPLEPSRTFAPLIFSVEGSGNFDVHEATWRTHEEWMEDPAGIEALPLSYRHALSSRIRTVGPYNDWLTMWIQPLDEAQFIVKADWLEDGGFHYHSDVEREYDLFPEASAGLRLDSGGGAMWQICPCEYKLTGALTSELHNRVVADTKYPDIETEKYEGPNTSVAVILEDEDGNEIVTGSEIDDWRYKATLSSDDGKDTPRLFRVTLDWTPGLTDVEADEEDLSADALNFEVSLSRSNFGRDGTFTLRNVAVPAAHDDLVQDPILELDIDIHGEDLVVMYVDNPTYEMWKMSSQDKQIPVITWEGGDAWRLLDLTVVKDSPDYSDMQLSDAIEKAMKTAGWEDADLDIDECTFKIPRGAMGQPALGRAADGIRLSELLARWHREFAQTYQMGFTRANKFQFKSPVAASTSRIFYKSHAEADAAYATAAEEFEGDPGDPDEPQEADYKYLVEHASLNIKVNTHDFRNEIWVFGLDRRKNRPLVAAYIDALSMNDPTYEYYAGMRRLLIYINTFLPTQDKVTWCLEELKKRFCQLRKLATFMATLDPTLVAGDYIEIFGLPEKWRIETMDIPVERGNVVPRTDQVVHCEYSVSEWPGADEDEEEEE